MHADPTGAPGRLLERIGQIAIEVDDLTRATAFYRDTLELQHLFTASDQMAFLQCGEIRVLLGRPEKGETRRKNSLIYFKVADIRTSEATLKQRGVTFLEEPHVVAEMSDHTLWMVHFRDSEGNDLLLMSEVPKTGGK